MKTTIAVKMVAGCLLGILAFSAAATEPVISDVVVRQRWPWSRLVDIDYVLACDPDQKVDVEVKAYDGPAALSLPSASLTGDLYDVSNGARRIVWNPVKAGYTNAFLPRFRVTLTPTPVPLYMIVDLTKEAGAEGQIEYVYEADLRAGAWGSWVEDPVTNAGEVVKSIVWTGVTTNDIYKTDKLVLRRIPAGSFTMGSPPGIEAYRSSDREDWHAVTLTKGYYIGVYEVTQGQWQKVMGNWPSYWNNADHKLTRPVERVSYFDIRENPDNTDDGTVEWPANDAVNADSFMGRLRSMTGLAGFDLPTDAQWEYACRAGTTGALNDGTVNITNSASDARLDVLGRYECNGGRILVEGAWEYPEKALGVAASAVTADHATAKVGSYLPNAWGLYDMHGNVWEWCLDWFVDHLGTDGVTDPEGPLSGASRVLRGGRWSGAASHCRSAYRLPRGPSARASDSGFRLMKTLP